jgi:hypothetical protein
MSRDVSSVETSRMVEELSRVVVAETIRSEQLDQLLLLPSLKMYLVVDFLSCKSPAQLASEYPDRILSSPHR